MDQTHEEDDPHAWLAIQRRSYGHGLRVALLRAGGWRHLLLDKVIGVVGAVYVCAVDACFTAELWSEFSQEYAFLRNPGLGLPLESHSGRSGVESPTPFQGALIL